MAEVRPSGARQVLRTLVACGLLVVAYYLAPVEPGTGGAELVIRLVLTVATIGWVSVLIVRLVVRTIRNEPGGRPASLVVALFGGLMLFALVDYGIAVNDLGQFVGLRTKTDALYFAVSTLATVGYGDITASGQFARAVVIAQQLFNLAVLATGGSVLVNRLTARLPAGGQR